MVYNNYYLIPLAYTYQCLKETKGATPGNLILCSLGKEELLSVGARGPSLCFIIIWNDV